MWTFWLCSQLELAYCLFPLLYQQKSKMCVVEFELKSLDIFYIPSLTVIFILSTTSRCWECHMSQVSHVWWFVYKESVWNFELYKYRFHSLGTSKIWLHITNLQIRRPRMTKLVHRFHKKAISQSHICKIAGKKTTYNECRLYLMFQL